ncbi:radical SAM protein [Gilvimarinus sp. SDUM040013]|uniref:Radical SAM protein n=1 Tax=Gilvimarinus gilvus TaxID=3058038 RepID=A0ABU4S581_9GAMM|nr:radical SAM protein [Gilvimarinus sp. SDUM040013]MDO3386010.1 radical SAM protein [Gilvimarinus sp. SDUM040013]MDX6850464.1 radical SAM protein [Gilvimarinus sp. SDUM040013]
MIRSGKKKELSGENPFSNFVRADIPGRFNELDVLMRQEDWLQASAQSEEIIPPYEVLIHPSSACNLACAWCIGDHVPIIAKSGSLINLVDASKTAEETLPNILSNVQNMESLIQGILDYKKKVSFLKNGKMVEREFGINTISFSGLIGEPLSSKASVLKAMNMAVESGKRVGIFTNGVLMDQRVIDVFSRIDYVHLSLDASTADVYGWLKFGDAKKGEDRFHKAVENLSKLVSKRNGDPSSSLRVNTSFILYPENYSQVYDAAKLVKEIGVDCFRVKTDNSGSRVLSPSQVLECKALLDKIEQDLVDEDFDFIRIHTFDRGVDFDRNFSKCRITDMMAAVGSDGCLYPCNYHPRPGGHNYGSAVANSFSDIWEGELRLSMKCGMPKICPDVCDPFKTRSNALLERFDSISYEVGQEKAFGYVKALSEELNIER